MAVSVTLPTLGESVTEGTVTRWLKAEGERVEADEPLLEVSTDKVDTEIPAPASGVLQSINGIVSLTRLYRIPLLMLISYRGEFGEKEPWQREGGGTTEPLLNALSIPFDRLDDPSHVAHRITKAQTLAEASLKPVALLLCRDLMWEE